MRKINKKILGPRKLRASLTLSGSFMIISGLAGPMVASVAIESDLRTRLWFTNLRTGTMISALVQLET